MLNNCSLYKKSVIKPKVSKHGKPIDVGIKNHIFIGYEHTDAIKDYIAKEYWGHLNKRLFYHINYTFRARLLTNEVCQFMWENNNNNHNNGIIGLFHTGLQSSKNGEFLYLIFKPNPEIRKQSWTLPNDAKNVSDYMMTKQEVVSKFGIKPNDLPGIPDYFSKKYYFYPGWRLVLEWDSALRMLLNHKTGGNSKKVILDEFSQNGVTINSNVMRQQLIQPLTNAVNEAMAGYHNDNDYVRPGIYFLDDGYQIVHQMILNVEYPQNSGKITKFVAVFEENKFQKQYTFTRLLNLEMAYKNARLVGKVPQSWCFRENNCVPTKKKQMKPSKPAPILINNYEYINSSVSNNNNNYKNNNNNNNSNNGSNVGSGTRTPPDYISTLYSNSNISDTFGLLPQTPLLNDAYVSPNPSLQSATTFPNITDQFSLPKNYNNGHNNSINNINVNINNNNNNNSNNNINNINSIPNINSMMNSNAYPKTFLKQRYRTLTTFNGKIVVEAVSENSIETSNMFAEPIKQSKTFGYSIDDLDAQTKTHILLSPQLNISSEHRIYQINESSNIETIEEVRKFKNGSSSHSIQTYLNVTQPNGQIQTTKFSGLNTKNVNNNINNNNNSIGYQYGTINSVTNNTNLYNNNILTSTNTSNASIIQNNGNSISNSIGNINNTKNINNII